MLIVAILPLHSRNSYEALQRTKSEERGRTGSTMHVTQVQLKMIAIGLIPVFFILSVIMPDSTTKTILLAGVVIIALVIIYTGWSMEKREAGENDDLLAIPPKKS